MKRTTREIADLVRGELDGDETLVLDSVASLSKAGPTHLTYADEKFHDQVVASTAGCVLVGFGRFPGKTVIVVRNPKLAFAKAANALLMMEPDARTIHTTAVIADDAQIADNVKI